MKSIKNDLIKKGLKMRGKLNMEIIQESSEDVNKEIHQLYHEIRNEVVIQTCRPTMFAIFDEIDLYIEGYDTN